MASGSDEPLRPQIIDGHAFCLGVSDAVECAAPRSIPERHHATSPIDHPLVAALHRAAGQVIAVAFLRRDDLDGHGVGQQAAVAILRLVWPARLLAFAALGSKHTKYGDVYLRFRC